ncbi:interleukin-21 isoform X2 [Cuculus canorus]|uniref:interleukin-21 isoform X2 n=1 Tax=Cuculus canorus TaxID=55661 RepID=UPI0023AB1240|nr:interleukin-21 isoform X2 [Cuculus canorus]
MEWMTIFYMLFFCSSTALTAAPHKAAKYLQLLKSINELEIRVKDKGVELLHTPENPVDECLFTAVTCFQNGTLKLQPNNSQENSTFTKAIKNLRRLIVRDSGKCESSCESYEKKTPKMFLKSFAKLIQKLFKETQS